MRAYETVIGLEVHVELATRTKIFCGCSTSFGGEPNTHCCPVCTGMPGALPVLNKRVVEFAVAVGLATGCEITRSCRFDRKNYFYPDLPKAYQVSQLYLPICREGHIEIEMTGGWKSVGIHEIHMEEDAGKLNHDPWSDCTLVDYNRCGVPLIEIVSDPDMRNAQEVTAYLEKLKLLLQYLGVSDCKMQEGSMRADINLSVRPMGATRLGTRTEMKNMNSFKAIKRAVEGEKKRQIELLESGRPVIQETRRWDENKEASFAMRSKEDAQDYRYFPELDLAPITISQEWLYETARRQPELKDAKKTRYMEEFKLPEYDAERLTSAKRLAELFEETVALIAKPKEISNWLLVETLRLMKEQEMEAGQLHFSPKHLARMIQLIEDGLINRTTAKKVFAAIFMEDVDPDIYIEEKGLKMVSDMDELRLAVEQVLALHPQSVADYRGGKEKAMGFLVGQVMKAMKGKAEPGMVKQLLKERC